MAGVVLACAPAAVEQRRPAPVQNVKVIATFPHDPTSFTQGLVDDFHSIHEAPFLFDAYRKTQGYANLPIDGAWARAPYLISR